MTIWFTGLAIGALFGFAWGFNAGRNSVVIVGLDAGERDD